MDWLRRISGVKHERYKIAETDTIYPVHFLDDSPFSRELILAPTWVFNDVLDADKIHEALTRLLEIGDWRKLGGRIRRKNKSYEVHVPQPFTVERPCVTYSHESHDVRLDEHPLSHSVPMPGPESYARLDPDGFTSFTTRPGAPGCLGDLVGQDIPATSLHVVSFNDVTLVTLSVPHILFDAMGLRDFARAWSQVLNGKENEVAPLLGAREDVAYEVADPAKREDIDFAFDRIKLVGFSLFLQILTLVWDVIFGPKMQWRAVFMPRRVLENLKAQAAQDLDDIQGKGEESDEGEERPFVSTNDVLVGWLARMAAAGLPRPRKISVLSIADLRTRIQGMCDPGGVYVQNLAASLITCIPADILKRPLGEMALAHRRALSEQASDEQLKAFLQMMRRDKDAGRDANTLGGDVGSLILVATSWAKGNYQQVVDFGPAVVKAGDRSPRRRNAPGAMSHHYAMILKPPSFARNTVTFLGTDWEGNFWMTGCLSASAWKAVEENMKELAA